MAIFGSLLLGRIRFPQPNLLSGERVAFQTRANWARHGVARGGTLVLTDRRLIFQPNSVEAGIGLEAQVWSRDTIEAVEVAPRNLNPFSGGIRRRLRVAIAGVRELFVVADLDAAVEALRGPPR